MAAVAARHDHPSADQIYLDVRQQDARISRGTVYRNLNLLAETGAITHVKVPTADRFDCRLDLHYHVICTRCGRVCDAPTHYHPDYDREMAEKTGFQISRHRTVFEGLCPDCQRETEAGSGPMPPENVGKCQDKF